MAQKRHRAFAAFGAILFLVTSSALTIAVIITIANQNSSSGSNTNNSNSSGSASNSSNKSLVGTKMQNFTPTSAPQNQLQTTDLKVGTGETVPAGATITADYVGALMKTGAIFDASKDHGGPQTFPLSGVIQGWQQGIPGMKVGGTRRLLIPASLAYGPQGSGSAIPPNSDLVFDVTVTKIDKK